MSVQIKASVTQISASASLAASRQHTSLVDRPAAKGGSDRGPMGGELLLMGVGGCFMSNLLAAAAARQLTLAETVVEVSAEIEGSPPRFSSITLTVSGGCTDREAMRELIVVAEHGCISVNTLKAQVELELALA
jgi:putative redox protein